MSGRSSMNEDDAPPAVLAEIDETLDDYIGQYESELRERFKELAGAHEIHAWDENKHPRGEGGRWGEGKGGKSNKDQMPDKFSTHLVPGDRLTL